LFGLPAAGGKARRRRTGQVAYGRDGDIRRVPEAKPVKTEPGA
jgi:hypothetical protein